MSIVLRKTAYSPNIKERADFSCAIFDNHGAMIAQAEAIPVHLGSMPFVAKPVIEMFQDWEDGDAIITNSPRAEFGGTHLPDITLLAPVFKNDILTHVVANRAHHADIGGMAPGSLPANSTEIFQEGLIIPPVKLFSKGKQVHDIMRFILENVRTPEERQGDLRAQYSSLMLGVRRIKELMSSNLEWDFAEMQGELLSRSEKGTRERLMKYGKGESSYEDYLDGDGDSDVPVKIRAKITLPGDGNIIFDFDGSDPERMGNCNAPFSVTTSACYYIVRLLTGRDVPSNAGCFEPVFVNAPDNSVVNPSRNVATSSANTETSSRIVDVLMGAISSMLPWPSLSQGTMNNVLIGGSHKGNAWSIYETIGGGTGAGPEQDGTSAIQSHMTNTENTPIEALELAYPLRIREYSIRRNSGGKGRFHGGDGVIREIELLDTATITLQTERRKFSPSGQNKLNDDSNDGTKGINKLYLHDETNPPLDILKIDGSLYTIVQGKVSIRNASKHSRLRIETPGGGGYQTRSDQY